jgi:hypothetical protein
MTYRADAITQRDGSELASSNCRMASAATGIDYHTAGGTTSTGAKMRDHSGDPSGGTTSDDAERAWAHYGEDLRVMDGHTWDDAVADLKDGRLVHLDIWAATTGGPCLSGSGAYGHTIAVAPERNSEGDKWLVADPWCSPPKWSHWSASKLKAGAEEWGRRCGRATAGLGYDSDIRYVPRPVLLAVVRMLMTIWTPEDPAPEDLEPGSTGGSQAILYTTTRKRSGASDVTINATGHVSSEYVLTTPQDCDWYMDAGLTQLGGTLGKPRDLPYLGLAVGTDARAVLLTTSKPYDDGTDRPSVVYVKRDVADPEPAGTGGAQLQE